MNSAVKKLDPSKQVDVGGYRLDADGNYKHKTVSENKSALKLSELIEKVCDKMDDYVRATGKEDGKLFLLKLMTEDGKMNPKMSEADIIQDDDLNKSVKYNVRILLCTSRFLLILYYFSSVKFWSKNMRMR